ncbi:hypothetical protein [Candidatus Hodgkinia cicadicola]|uniref:hypothetical protein n=1 Tax=Candidatus Hodgkinia cicadicola TaxID=573658 RepID=UPI001788CA0A
MVDIVDSSLLVDGSHIADLIVIGLQPSPIEHYNIVTLTTHRSLRGLHDGLILLNNRESFNRISDDLFPWLRDGPMMDVIAVKTMVLFEKQQDDNKTWTRSVVDNAKAMFDRFKNNEVQVLFRIEHIIT